jgi:hypothetical protein
MDAIWVNAANLVATCLLVLVTAIYGKKFSEAKKAELEAKQAEIAAKQGVIDAKQAEIAAKDALIASLKELNPEAIRRYTLAIQEQLNDAIQLKEQEKAKLQEELDAEKMNRAAQSSRIEELERQLNEKSGELDVAQNAATGVHVINTFLNASDFATGSVQPDDIISKNFSNSKLNSKAVEDFLQTLRVVKTTNKSSITRNKIAPED